MKKPINRALVIHSLCSIGKASITNILPIMSIRGIEVCPIPTVVLSSHTGGFKSIAKIDSKNFIKQSLESMNKNKINFDLTLIGYLGNKEKIEQVELFLKEKKDGLVILDTIFGDNNTLYNGFNNDYVEKLKSLLKYSDLITPNFTEALYLTGRKEKDFLNFQEEDIKDILKDLRKIGAKNIVITSVPCNDKIGIAILEGENLSIIKHERLEKSYPGTGDIFTATLCTELLKKNTLEDGVKNSADFVKGCIEYSIKYDYETKEGVLLEKQLYKLL